jgi:uncharacterized protein (DUF1800 family)
MDMPVQYSHLARVKTVAATLPAGDQWRNRPTIWQVNDSMWLGMVNSQDQLRQRLMFALSQIFVVSLRDGSTYYLGNGLASYVDLLYANAFGNYRQLLEAVSLSPAMGSYLSHMYNRKEDTVTGAKPDQNFAREVMQLFSIGLWELNADGTLKLDAQGRPIPTYSTDDVVGVSRVLTGWAFDGATDSHWSNYYGFWDFPANAAQERPMRANARYHSTLEKKFLGTTITAGGTPDPVGNLKILLDRLHSHSNTGPFISRQLIQRLVTSNPSREYVGRVSAVWANNGSGVRGDLRSVVKAILLDPEARSSASVTTPSFGKIREPILRMTQLMRVFKGRTDADPDSLGIGLWQYDRSKGLWQTPLGAQSVFNFYQPGYPLRTPDMAQTGLVAPEMQITTQSSVADMSFFFLDVLQNGGITSCCSETARNTFYLKLDYSDWLPLVANPPQLIERLNQTFMAGQMSPALKDAITRQMADRGGQASSETSGITRGNAQIKLAEAIYTMLFSAEYVVQK